MKINHAIKQISALGYKDGDRVYLRSFHPEKGKDYGCNADFAFPEIPEELIEDWQQQGRGVYLVINQGGHKDEDIDRCVAIFYEHDDVDEAGLQFLQKNFPGAEFLPKEGKSDRWLVPLEVQQGLWVILGLPEPTMQIATGGKSLHSYWVLEESIDVAAWRQIQADLLEFANADRKLKNPSRVMRLAGCLHASGEYSRIVAGCGQRYKLEELRSLIPAAKERASQPGSVVTWSDFNQNWRYPILDSVPLETCLSKKNRDLLKHGAQDGGRNDSGFKLAVDLLAVTSQLVHDGQRFSGDPYDLFIQYCQRCTPGDGWSQREWDLIWKSAQSKSRNSSLPPEHIENCVKGWAWSNCPNRPVDIKGAVSSIGKSFPEPKKASLVEIPDDAEEEDRIRMSIENYNRVLDSGNLFQQIRMRRMIAKEWGITASEVDALSRYLMRGQRGEVEDIASVLDRVTTEINERAISGVVPGVVSGFYDLDAMTQGFQRSDLIVVAARPSMGKTSLALNVARNIAALQKIPAAIFSLEMSKDALAYRLLSGDSRIDSGRLRAGRLQQNEWEPLGHAVSVLAQAPIFIDDTPEITVSDIRTKCRRLLAEVGEIGIIMIDYLQIMGGANADPVNALDRITSELKALGRELNTPIIALSQLSRGVESRDNKRPTMSDIRNSGGIEQNADLIMMLYRDEYYSPDSTDRGIAELIIAKHRNGPIGTVKLLFEPQFTQFRNLSKPGGFSEPIVPARPVVAVAAQPVQEEEWEEVPL